MGKILLFGAVLLVVFSCKEDKKGTSDDTTAYDVSIENWPEKSKVNAKVEVALKEWSQYVDLDNTFDGLYSVENTEDLILIVEDLIEKQKLLSESDYPETFDQPQIKSRQKVFHTFVLKTKGDLEYRVDPQQSVKEMIEAYNALRNQFEVITNNTLDIKKLLEE